MKILKYILISISLLANLSVFASTIKNFESLLAFLDKNQEINELEEVLAILPDDLKKNYTLVYDSKSMQTSSYQNPRAILFGSTGQFIIAFNGGDLGYTQNDALEIMDFDDIENKINLYSLNFPLERSSEGMVLTKDLESGRLSRPERNPKSCLSCHGNDPMAIWEKYNKWPGVYGSLEDSFGNDTERKEYFKFLQVQGQHPRYKYLIRQGNTEEAPYSPTMRFGNITTRPNLRLNAYIMHMNAKRTTQLLVDSPDYNNLKLPALYSFLNCSKLKSYKDILPTPLENIKTKISPLLTSPVSSDDIFLEPKKMVSILGLKETDFCASFTDVNCFGAKYLQIDPLDTVYSKVNGSIIELVTHRVFKDVIKDYQKIGMYYKDRPYMSLHLPKVSLSGGFKEFYQAADQLGTFFTYDQKKTCKLIVEEINREFK